MDQFNESFQCQACKICFENSNQLLLHVKYHTSIRSFKCMLCDQFHQRYSPYDRLRQNNRYVGCVHRNNVDFNHINKKQSCQRVTEQASCQKVTRVKMSSGPKEYAEEIDIDDWIDNLDLEDMTLEQLRATKEMLGSMLAEAEDFDIESLV